MMKMMMVVMTVMMMMMMHCLLWLRFRAKPGHLPYIYICIYLYLYTHRYRQIVSRQKRKCCWLVRSAGLFGPAAGADTLEPFD
jgi:hypothetical protein